MEDLSEDINIIKSLIAIAKGGLPVSRICSEYYEMTNNRLNFAKYGFRSIQDMLKSSSEIVFKQTCDGPVCSVNDAKISHVTALVEKTRSKKKKSRGKRHFCYPGRSSNYVPSRNLSVLYRGQGQFRNNSKNLSLQFRGQTQSYNNSKNVSLPSKKQSQSYNYSKNASLQYKGQTQSCNNSRANYYQAKQPCQLRDRPQLQYLSNNSLQLQGPRPVINIPAKSINKDPHSSKSNQVQSSSDDGWSSSCSDWSEEPLSDQECKQKRSAEVIRDCISNNTNVVSSLRITVPNSRNSSGSDWSDSDEVSLTGQTQGEKLEFSVEGNPTRFQTLGISRLNPLTRTLNSSQGVNLGDRPLMGGVGRGSSRRLASFKSERIEPLLPVNGGIIVSGSPAKREVVAANSSITIRLPNSAYNNSCQSFKEIDSWGPSYQNFRFVGDMYLLRVAQICLGFQERVQKSESACGLCRNNLTISDCEKEIAKIGAPPMIILMIGMADILKEATIEDMQRATVSLLQRLKKHQVVLISLPTPPSFLKSGNLGKLSVLEKFNKWLLALDFPVKIDINKHLHCDRLYYERDPNSAVETFSEGGSWIVMHEIVSVLLQCEEWKLTAKTN